VGLTVGLAGCATQVPGDLAPEPSRSRSAPEPIPQPRPQPTSSAVTTTTEVVRTKPALDPAAVVAAVRSVEPRATVAAVVVDRTTGAPRLELNADRPFRSASLVKLLIAIDALERGEDAALDKRLSYMLRMSDDATASSLWVAGGGSALVTRTAARIGLRATRPPRIPGQWGDVMLTAADVVRIYQFILTGLPAGQSRLILDALASAPRVAADGFDQYFGIPDGLGGPFAIKQGWSNSKTDIVLHSTGLVGDHIVVLLTEHPVRSSWSTDARAVTAGARALSPLR
jgi:hypothetical protein